MRTEFYSLYLLGIILGVFRHTVRRQTLIYFGSWMGEMVHRKQNPSVFGHLISDI